MLIIKIVFYLFHLVLGFIIGAVLSASFGNAVGITIMIVYWIFSFRWTFLKKKKLVSKALNSGGTYTLKQSSKQTKDDISLLSDNLEISHDIEPSLEDFKISRPVEKSERTLKSEHLIHDDLVDNAVAGKFYRPIKKRLDKDRELSALNGKLRRYVTRQDYFIEIM